MVNNEKLEVKFKDENGIQTRIKLEVLDIGWVA